VLVIVLGYTLTLRSLVHAGSSGRPPVAVTFDGFRVSGPFFTGLLMIAVDSSLWSRQSHNYLLMFYASELHGFNLSDKLEVVLH